MKASPLAALPVVVAVDALALVDRTAALVAAATLAFALAATAGASTAARVARTAPLVVAVTVVLYALLLPGGERFAIAFLTLHESGARFGLRMGVRFAVFLAAALWLVAVTRGRDALDLVRRLRMPSLALAARAAPALAHDARRIREAQAMRGLAPRVLRADAFLAPLFVLGLRRAEATGRSLATVPRATRPTFLRPVAWTRSDGAWLTFAFAVAAAATVLGVGAWP